MTNHAGPTGLDDDASPDEQGDHGLDLSPRRTATAIANRPGRGSANETGRSGPSGRSKWPWLLVIVALVGAIAFVISRAITDASLLYRTADEALAQQAQQGDRPFRLEGTVEKGSRHDTADGVTFVATSGGAKVNVHHVGDPPQLFQECIPVVVEGHWSGTGAAATFESRSIIVAHDSNYEAQNSDRIQKARAEGETGSSACAAKAAAGLNVAAAS